LIGATATHFSQPLPDDRLTVVLSWSTLIMDRGFGQWVPESVCPEMSDMISIYYISPEARNKLQKEARRYKREHQCGHRDALEAIAKKHGFDNWQQVADGVTLWAKSQQALESGCVIAYDVSESDDLSELGFVADPGMWDHCSEDLFKRLRSSVDEGDPQGRTFAETKSEKESREFHEDDRMNLQFFRLDTTVTPLPTSPAAVFDLLKPVAFFMPMHVWLQGTLYYEWSEMGLPDHQSNSDQLKKMPDWNPDDDFMEDGFGQDFDS